jgi:predicted phage-related endonuclease|tara:strand:- start:93 stop:377 length:285 start_codon:yes stop_codon:yes gene_type:complete
MTLATAKVISLRNPLKAFVELKSQIDELKSQFKAAKEKVLAEMDGRGVDTLKIGDYKANRKFVEQSRVDTKAVRDLLGDKTPTTLVESVRLTVI